MIIHKVVCINLERGIILGSDLFTTRVSIGCDIVSGFSSSCFIKKKNNGAEKLYRFAVRPNKRAVLHCTESRFEMIVDLTGLTQCFFFLPNLKLLNCWKQICKLHREQLLNCNILQCRLWKNVLTVSIIKNWGCFNKISKPLSLPLSNRKTCYVCLKYLKSCLYTGPEPDVCTEKKTQQPILIKAPRIKVKL